MRKAIATTALTLAAVAVFQVSGQEPAVSNSTIWRDTVKRGDMQLAVRGLGVITANNKADLKIAESQVKSVALGQGVSIDTRQNVIHGKVYRIDPAVINGTVTVSVDFEAPATTLPVGLAVDGTIEIATLSNVVFVGRPVFGQANSETTLFKVDPDGQSATRVKVRFGQTSVNVVEIVEGLQPGDRVILSDMTPYEKYNRLRLQ